MARSVEPKENVIVTTTTVDAETGELLARYRKEVWGGWKNDSYRFRSQANPLKIYQDTDMYLSAAEMGFMVEICKQMNSENLFIGYRRPTKKYHGEKYYPLTKDDIFYNMSRRVSKSTFEKHWRTLNGKYIKRIKVEDMSVWAVNPAYFSKIKFMPVYLYFPFKTDIDPFLNEMARTKFENVALEQFL